LQTIAIQFTSISAERLAMMLPPRIDFSVNIAIPSSEPIRRENQYMIPFTFTVSSTPPVVQITLKGIVLVSSDKRSELDKIEEELTKKKQVPPPIIQAVFVNALAEVILLSRSLALPPPIPIPPQLIQVKSSDHDERRGFEQGPVI